VNIFLLEGKYKIKSEKKNMPDKNFSQNELWSIVNKAPLAFVAIDRECKIIEINQKTEKLFGYLRLEIIGTNFIDLLLLPESKIKYKSEFEKLVETKNYDYGSKSIALKTLHKSGHTVYVQLNIFDIAHEESLVLGMFLYEAKKDDKTSGSSTDMDNMLQLVMDNIPQAIFWKDLNSVYMGCNRVFAIKAGAKSPAEIVGKTDYDLAWTKEESDFSRQCDEWVIHNNKPEYHIIESQKRSDGKLAWLDTNKIPLHDEDGNVTGIMGTYEDITERALLTQQREDFMAALAHDLKVPIIGALRAMDLLLNQTIGSVNEKQHNFITKLKESHEDLLHMIQNMLQILRYEAKVEDLHLENCDLAPVVINCVSELKLLAQSKHIDISFAVPEKLLITADRFAIQRVLFNLVGNAIKFTPDHGVIKVMTHKKNDKVEIVVHNTGEAISSTDQRRLFQRFWQAGAHKRHSVGTGLGLYLCKQIIESHGGEINCKSNLKEGTSFIVELPISAKLLD
jgi:PAS domain S-box-containing protein